MKAAPGDLHRRLAILRQRMQHPTAYEKALAYFGDHFSGDRRFLDQSVPVHPDCFAPMLGQLVSAVLREPVRLEQPMVMCLPELGFYHGCARAPRRVVTFFYAADLAIGIAGLVPGLRGGACEVARFRFLLQPPPRPEQN